MSGTLYCSFCGKTAAEVALLIRGPGVNICNECVDLCVQIVTAGGKVRRGELLTEDPDHGDGEP